MQIDKMTLNQQTPTDDSLRSLFTSPKVVLEPINTRAPDMDNDRCIFRNMTTFKNAADAFNGLGILSQKAARAYLEMGAGNDIGLNVKIEPDKKTVILEASANNPRALAVFRLLTDINADSNDATTTLNKDSSPQFVSQWAKMADTMMASIGLPVEISRAGTHELQVKAPTTQTQIMYELGANEGWFDKSAQYGKPLPMPTAHQLIADWKAGIKAPAH